MSEQFYSIVTDAGDRAIADAIKTGTTKTLKYLAVGDAGGAYYEPAKSQTALRAEKWRGKVSVTADPGNQKRVVITATIPSSIGGFSIREAGIFDEAGILMAVSKQPLSDKVLPESGAAKDVTIRIYLEVTDAGAITLQIDPSAQNVTRVEFEEHLKDQTIHISAEDRDRWDHKAARAIAREITLQATGWSQSAPYTQTVQIEGVTSANHKVVSLKADAALELRELYSACGVHASREAQGSMIFTADYERPAKDLPVSVLIVG